MASIALQTNETKVTGPLESRFSVVEPWTSTETPSRFLNGILRRLHLRTGAEDFSANTSVTKNGFDFQLGARIKEQLYEFRKMIREGGFDRVRDEFNWGGLVDNISALISGLRPEVQLNLKGSFEKFLGNAWAATHGFINDCVRSITMNYDSKLTEGNFSIDELVTYIASYEPESRNEAIETYFDKNPHVLKKQIYDLFADTDYEKEEPDIVLYNEYINKSGRGEVIAATETVEGEYLTERSAA